MENLSLFEVEEPKARHAGVAVTSITASTASDAKGRMSGECELGGMGQADVSSLRESAHTLNAQSLSSILVGLKVHGFEQSNSFSADPHARLVELLQSPSVGVILKSAHDLAERQGMHAEDALKLLVTTLKELDQLWSQVLLKEGLSRLSTQFH